MHIEIPHKYKSIEEAVGEIKKIVDGTRGQVAGKATIEEERWGGNTLHFAFVAEGHHVSGTLAVGEKEFVLDAKLPLMFKLFEGKVERMIKSQAEAMLGK